MDSPRKILVTYASRGGSTAEIAAFIHQSLVTRGIDADLSPMVDVEDLTSYQAVVAGSAIQFDKWLPEAMDFMQQHQDTLRQKPFAAFLVCLGMSRKSAQAQRSAEAWMQPVLSMVTPVSAGYFAGVLNLRKVPFVYRLLFRVAITLTSWTEGDFRDWDAIQHWADDLPVNLQLS